MSRANRNRFDAALHPRSVELHRFIDREYARVVGAVALITGDHARAEDAVQDAIVKAWRWRDEPIARIAAWITVVATNQARSGHRRQRSEQRALERTARQRAAHAELPDPSDTRLQLALAGLPLRERQVATLHYALDLSVADCAVVLDVADGTVKTLLSRARSHLAAALDPSAARHQQTGYEQGGVA